MAKKKEKTAEDLLENPQFGNEFFQQSEEMTPFDKTYNVLTATGGPQLELMTRTTKKLAKAIDVGYNLMFNYRSMYIRGRLDTLMRLHVSMGGKGRAEMVQSLQAGSGVTDGFYDRGDGMPGGFQGIGAEDDPDEE